MNRPDSMAKNMPIIAEVKRSQVADFRKNCNCGVAVAVQHFFTNLRKCFLQVAELQLRTQKKVARALLWIWYYTYGKLLHQLVGTGTDTGKDYTIWRGYYRNGLHIMKWIMQEWLMWERTTQIKTEKRSKDSSTRKERIPPRERFYTEKTN
jgi:hypothetical protein